ncbi:hypothetical protein EXIGLDRAFT_836346 [Exidia glandulosa HHB12029]|uniref:Uncharacterized protein n=1 Tax=Exidia glandulosa HHB12029 TaxID=1314781 RepID=A0A165HW86_EXIGL|nr:hypothetical protein EXIGLDRAFT_836346 [Exidia glandulosa HHB12029]
MPAQLYAAEPFWKMENAFHVKDTDGSVHPFNLADPTTDGGELSRNLFEETAVAPPPLSKTLSGTSVSSRIGDVGYLDPWTQRFTVLFNAFDPARTGARTTLRTARSVSDPFFSVPPTWQDKLRNTLQRSRSRTPEEPALTSSMRRGRVNVVELSAPMKAALLKWFEYYIYEILFVYETSEHWLWGVESIMIRTGGVEVLSNASGSSSGSESSFELQAVSGLDELCCRRFAVEMFGKLVWPKEWESASKDSLLEPVTVA